MAQRLKQSGYTTGCSVGDTVPYIICCEPVRNAVDSVFRLTRYSKLGFGVIESE